MPGGGVAISLPARATVLCSQDCGGVEHWSEQLESPENNGLNRRWFLRRRGVDCTRSKHTVGRGGGDRVPTDEAGISGNATLRGIRGPVSGNGAQPNGDRSDQRRPAARHSNLRPRRGVIFARLPGVSGTILVRGGTAERPTKARSNLVRPVWPPV
jgi:hypothetical protein